MIYAEFVDELKLDDVRLIYNSTYKNEFNLNEYFYNVSQDENHYSYVVAYENKIPVGTGRYNHKNNVIDKVIVILDKRRQYYGDLIVRMLIDKFFRLDVEKISVFAFQVEIPFYQKIGFLKTDQKIHCDNIERDVLTIRSDQVIKRCNH